MPSEIENHKESDLLQAPKEEPSAIADFASSIYGYGSHMIKEHPLETAITATVAVASLAMLARSGSKLLGRAVAQTEGRMLAPAVLETAMSIGANLSEKTVVMNLENPLARTLAGNAGKVADQELVQSAMKYIHGGRPAMTPSMFSRVPSFDPFARPVIDAETMRRISEVQPILTKLLGS